MAVAAGLFYLIRSRRLHGSILQDLGIVATIVAAIAAILVFILPTAPSPDNDFVASASPTGGLLQPTLEVPSSTVEPTSHQPVSSATAGSPTNTRKPPPTATSTITTSPQPTQPDTQLPSPTLTPERLLLEDFSDNNMQGWSVFGNQAKSTDGMLVLIGEPLVVALIGADNWTDYSLSAKVKLVAGGDFAILVGADESCSLYLMQFVDRAPRIVRFDGRSCPSDYSYTILFGGSYRLESGIWYDIRVDFVDTQIAGYINGAKVVWAEDASYLNGKVGFRAYNSQVFIDDVLVEPWSKP